MDYIKGDRGQDPLWNVPRGLGRKPPTTRQIRTGWCGFCQEPHPLHLIKGVGYLCPKCGGRLLGNHPGITRHIYRG